MKAIMIKSMIWAFALILTVPVYSVTPENTPANIPENGATPPQIPTAIAPGGVTAIDKAGVQVIEVPGLPGVPIAQVTPGGPFANAGIEPKDVVLAVNTHPTKTIAQFGNEIAKATGSIQVSVIDHNSQRLFVITVAL